MLPHQRSRCRGQKRRRAATGCGGRERKHGAARIPLAPVAAQRAGAAGRWQADPAGIGDGDWSVVNRTQLYKPAPKIFRLTFGPSESGPGERANSRFHLKFVPQRRNGRRCATGRTGPDDSTERSMRFDGSPRCGVGVSRALPALCPWGAQISRWRCPRNEPRCKRALDEPVGRCALPRRAMMFRRRNLVVKRTHRRDVLRDASRSFTGSGCRDACASMSIRATERLSPHGRCLATKSHPARREAPTGARVMDCNTRRPSRCASPFMSTLDYDKRPHREHGSSHRSTMPRSRRHDVT